jgi:sulfopropanediol 3-dehydrogenase
LVESDEELAKVGDLIASEHTQIIHKNPGYFLENMKNYGSLFVGVETNVAYGDKNIGTNHTLPTLKASRYTGGLWVGKFMKTVTHQSCTKEASVKVGELCSRISNYEGMIAHGY